MLPESLEGDEDTAATALKYLHSAGCPVRSPRPAASALTG